MNSIERRDNIDKYIGEIEGTLDTIKIHIMNGASETMYDDLMVAIRNIWDELWDIHTNYIEPCLRNTE
jgi:hypothetical protein